MTNNTSNIRIINIPFKKGGASYDGCDCIGLVYLYFNDILNIEFKNVLGFTEHSKYKANEFINYVKSNHNKFKSVPINEIKKNDVGIFKNKNLTIHCGVFVDRDYLLHTTEGHRSVIEFFKNSYWKQNIIGLYRHENFL